MAVARYGGQCRGAHKAHHNCNDILDAINAAHAGWELRTETVFVLKGGKRVQDIHLDWHKIKRRASVNPGRVEWDWCEDSLTFFCPLEVDRPLALGGTAEPLMQRPDDVTLSVCVSLCVTLLPTVDLSLCI